MLFHVGPKTSHMTQVLAPRVMRRVGVTVTVRVRVRVRVRVSC